MARFPVRRLALLALALAAAAPHARAAPDLVFRGVAVLDPAALGGDNDRWPEPGETFDLVLALGNEGDTEARSIAATLSSSDPRLVVQAVPASVGFPDLAPGALGSSLAPGFRVTAAHGLGCGEPVALDLAIAFTDPLGSPLGAVRRFLLFAGEETRIASEDFDTGPAGWEQDDAGSTPVEPPNRAGRWVNAAPQFYLRGNEPAQPGRDATWPDVSAMYTGQNLDPADPSRENVDGGNQVLRSRAYDLTGRSAVWASWQRWFFTDDPAGADSLELQASGDGGVTWRPLERLTARANAWTPAAARLDGLIPLGPAVRFRAIAADLGAASVVEAALDDFRLASYACGPDPAEARLDSADPVVADGVDPQCSDGDGRPDAGETFDFTVTVTNLGTAPAAGATATLVSPLPGSSRSPARRPSPSARSPTTAARPPPPGGSRSPTRSRAGRRSRSRSTSRRLRPRPACAARTRSSWRRT